MPTREKFSKYPVWILGLLLGLFMNAAVLAQTPTEAPQAVIEDASNQIRTKLRDQVFSKDFNAVVNFVDSVIDSHIDFDLMSALVLGKFWKTASPSERQQFKQAFKNLLVRTYARVFVEFNDWKIEFLPGSERDGEQKALIKSRVKQTSQQSIAVDYRMLKQNGIWKVYDILIDGVSLVTTYRSNFKYDIDAMGSIAPLIDKLVKKNSEAIQNPQ